MVNPTFQPQSYFDLCSKRTRSFSNQGRGWVYSLLWKCGLGKSRSASWPSMNDCLRLHAHNITFKICLNCKLSFKLGIQDYTHCKLKIANEQMNKTPVIYRSFDDLNIIYQNIIISCWGFLCVVVSACLNRYYSTFFPRKSYQKVIKLWIFHLVKFVIVMSAILSVAFLLSMMFLLELQCNS